MMIVLQTQRMLPKSISEKSNLEQVWLGGLSYIHGESMVYKDQLKAQNQSGRHAGVHLIVKLSHPSLK